MSADDQSVAKPAGNPKSDVVWQAGRNAAIRLLQSNTVHTGADIAHALTGFVQVLSGVLADNIDDSLSDDGVYALQADTIDDWGRMLIDAAQQMRSQLLN